VFVGSLRTAQAVVLLISVSALPAACSKKQSPPVQSATPSTAAGAVATGGEGAQTVTGPVLETMNAASYTYVRVRTDTGEIWAAAPQFPVKVGDRVAVALEMPMTNFHSESLKRDFPLLYFVSRIARAGESASAGGAAPAPGLTPSHGGVPAAPAQTIEPMGAPPGGTSISDLWANRRALAGKTVTVRARVVKFNGGILGHNWVHLQDGTGKAADGSNDITVTTPEDLMVAVGDTITVTGTIAIDKDLGAGYVYPVLIENARQAGATKQKSGT
jgi:hypothetical protein